MSGGLLEKAQNIEVDESAEPVEPEVSDSDGGGGLLERAGESSSSSASPLLTPNAKKGIAGGLVTILILFIAYQAVMGFSFGGDSISVAGLEIDEADDELRVQVFIGTPMIGGIPDDSLLITIGYNGTDVHTATFEPKAKLAWYEIPFTDFYQGNSRGAAVDSSDIEYTVTVSQGSSSSTGYSADAAMMDRTINTVDGELIAITEPNTNCQQNGDNVQCENNGLNHLGSQFRVGAGAIDPVESNSTSIMLHVESDYTIDATISNDNSVVFTFPTVSVDGSSATWDGGDGLVEGAWLNLDGDGSKDDGFGEPLYFVLRDNFYGGDGCYTIDITVTHQSPFGEVISDSASQGYQFWWEYNENRDTSDNNGDGEPDEPYKPTEAC